MGSPALVLRNMRIAEEIDELRASVQLAFGMNHIGVLGDDAKKVISEEVTILARQSSYSQATATRIIRTHLPIAIYSCNALSVNVRKSSRFIAQILLVFKVFRL